MIQVNERFLKWIKDNQDPDATEFVSAETYGSDWDGDTEGGFYSTFEVTLKWLSGQERKSHFVTGEDMESLWKAVVF